MDTREVISGEAQYIVPTYARPEVVFEYGQGAYLYDTEGKLYLDFTAGIAVSALGHADPEWCQVVADQAGSLVHVSNLYHTEPQVALARRLVEHSFADKVFFCNSGSEANETAFKFARKVAKSKNGPGDRNNKNGIVAFSGSFHGRTMGALSATYKEKYRSPFIPLVPGFTFGTFNDLAFAEATISDETCAVIVEPIQGEGGINVATPAFLKGLRELCDKHDALLIFDEVQCGLGRSGTLWAYEGYSVEPDIMTLAKPLAGGLPIGAVLVREKVAEVMKVGDHGSTFAGGPLVCRAAQVVFDRISRPEFLSSVAENGRTLKELLTELAAVQPQTSGKITDVRGKGLLVGVAFDVPVAPLVAAARASGLLVISAGENVLRLCPPLIINQDQISAGIAILADCLHVL